MSDILHNPCKEMWETAKDFKDLQNAMVEYLEGRCPNNPWMVDKIDDETIPILNSLVKINRYGFVTIQGQPGVNTTQESGSMVCQRAYMDGFILKKNSSRFINDLLKTKKSSSCKNQIRSYSAEKWEIQKYIEIPS